MTALSRTLCALALLFALTAAEVSASASPTDAAPLTSTAPDVSPTDEIAIIEDMEASLAKLRFPTLRKEHELDPVHLTTIRLHHLAININEIAVHINGEHSAAVLLHSDGVRLSFAIPEDVVLDDNMRQQSNVKVSISGVSLDHLPSVAELVQLCETVDFHKYSMKHDPLGTRSRDFRDTATEHHDNVEHAHKDDAERQRVAEIIGKDEDVAQKLHQEAEKGNAAALTDLAARYLVGDDGVPRDLVEALRLLRIAVGQGYADAQALLAFLHASGTARPHLPKSVATAVLLWEFAAAGGSRFAKTALAFRRFTGTDVPQDCEGAAKLYSEVAFDALAYAVQRDRAEPPAPDDDQGEHEQAAADFGWRGVVADITAAAPPAGVAILARTRLDDEVRRVRPSSKQRDVAQYVLHAARRGDPAALVTAGDLHARGGAGVPRDSRRARELYVRAVRAGRADARARLGLLDLKAGRNRSAYTQLNHAAEAGSRAAHHGLGLAFLHGAYVDKNSARALLHLRLAADKKYADAHYVLARIYFSGLGDDVARDLNRAYNSLVSAAELGHLKAQYVLGRMAMQGSAPAPHDCAEACRSFRVVAEHAEWRSLLWKALLAYEDGRFKAALHRYLLAAHAGIEVAQFNAAYMYDRALVADQGDQDTTLSRSETFAEALELYHYSALSGATTGAPLAMLRMGDLVYREHGDFKRAASVYEGAARLKNAEALFNLGVMHALGRGLQHNTHLAKRYFNQAIEADRDAFLPATIALFALRYSHFFTYLVNLLLALLERLGLRESFDDFLAQLKHLMEETEFRSDAAVVTALLVALVFTVHARRRLRVDDEDVR